MTQTDRLDLDQKLISAPGGASAAVDFRSILFGSAEADISGAQEPVFFGDLNLDQVVASIVAGRDEYDLRSFFWMPLRDVEAVAYRHEVFRDLETDELGAAVRGFGDEMRRTRQYLTLARKQYFKYEKERWFLDASAIYCDAVSALAGELDRLEPGSRGLRTLRAYLRSYTASERFTRCASDAAGALEGLERVKYTVRIRGAA